MTDQTTSIALNADKTVDLKDFKFRFKKDKMGNQRKTVELKLPVPSLEGIVSILESGSQAAQQLLLDVVYDCVRDVAGTIVGDSESITQENFPLDKITWEAIATQPRAERTKIAQEVWDAFAADYLDVMPAVTGKNNEQLSAAVSVYVKKFTLVKTNKEVLSMLKTQLGLYMEHSKKAEEFTEILDLLLGKVDTYLKSDDVAQLIANL
jgi:hypothetical protein